VTDKKIEFDGTLRVSEKGVPKQIEMDMPSLNSSATMKLKPSGEIKSVKVRPYRKVQR